jgi:hypothetical protein
VILPSRSTSTSMISPILESDVNKANKAEIAKD